MAYKEKKIYKDLGFIPPKVWKCEDCGKELSYPHYKCEYCKTQIIFMLEKQSLKKQDV